MYDIKEHNKQINGLAAASGKVVGSCTVQMIYTGGFAIVAALSGSWLLVALLLLLFGVAFYSRRNSVETLRKIKAGEYDLPIPPK